MTKEEALKVILADIDSAKKAKKDIDSKITTWINEYEGNPYGNEKNGRSKIVIKDIKKAVEWFLPNAVEPFVENPRIVKFNGITADDVPPAMMHERLINYQFTRRFDRYNFIYDMFRVSSTEGTVVIRTGWDYEEDVKTEKFENVTAQHLIVMEQNGLQFNEPEQNEDGTYNVTAKAVNVIKNYPTAKVCRNEDVFPDPQSDCVENADFVAYRYEASISELKASGKYSDEDLAELSMSLETKDSELASERKTSLRDYGKDVHYESIADANKKVTVYEYWGHLDMNGDGISEPVFATIVDDELLEIGDNPMPDKEIPFVNIPFSKVPFAFWGYPMAELLSDNQKVRSSLMRGFIDNVAQSNNGKKFIRKGAMDAVNKRKYENNIGGLIEYNGDPNEFFDGNYNPLQPSIFNLYELVQQESESLSGINRTMQGVDSRGINDSATGAAIQQDMGTKRLMDIIRRHSEGLKKVFRKWIAYNKEFLTDQEVMRISGEFIPFRRDDISGEFDIDVTVGVDGVSEAKVNQMTMLMQQVGGLSNVATIPQGYFNRMLAKIADEWGYPDIAQELEEAKAPQPSQEQQQAMMMELEKLKAEIEEMRSKTQLNEAKAIETMSSANSKNVESKKSALGIVDKPKS